MTVQRIVLQNTAAGKAQATSSIKTNSFSILGLFLQLGITWAFAVFSYGPLLIASYYIFTILNSFQGFFLFIYYFNSSTIAREDRSFTASGSTTDTSNTVVTNPH
ncbi:hypothetical protein FQN60_009049 [Etheostoma spectabile]|uniref:G-protein coupled receptors family 2 profile 2 domain-containing protein n=2 Tax=Etheostoma spectabile TaxID=54343 RepID=A0A5J5CN43_9PERO|nr:hypothetical protein FQN60_009049 [Etheostoma spectabile]